MGGKVKVREAGGSKKDGDLRTGTQKRTCCLEPEWFGDQREKNMLQWRLYWGDSVQLGREHCGRKRGRS